MGESPTRPCRLWARPDVVQTPPSEPFLSRASTVTVSCESDGIGASGGAAARRAAGTGLGRVFSHLATLSGVLNT